jgi:hypothetical protein
MLSRFLLREFGKRTILRNLVFLIVMSVPIYSPSSFGLAQGGGAGGGWNWLGYYLFLPLLRFRHPNGYVSLV